VAEGGLNQGDRRPAIERVRGMGVPQPVCRDRRRQAGASRRRLNDAVDLHRGEVAALDGREIGPARLAAIAGTECRYR
jgi:hypothetical protein